MPRLFAMKSFKLLKCFSEATRSLSFSEKSPTLITVNERAACERLAGLKQKNVTKFVSKKTCKNRYLTKYSDLSVLFVWIISVGTVREQKDSSEI